MRDASKLRQLNTYFGKIGFTLVEEKVSSSPPLRNTRSAGEATRPFEVAHWKKLMSSTQDLRNRTDNIEILPLQSSSCDNVINQLGVSGQTSVTPSLYCATTTASWQRCENYWEGRQTLSTTGCVLNRAVSL
jgi:hypothetical protein